MKNQVDQPIEEAAFEPGLEHLNGVAGTQRHRMRLKTVMDTAHLSRIESGKAVPSINMTKKLADALGLPIATLFSDIPAQKVQDHGWAGKMGAMVRDMTPKQRSKVLRVLKSIVSKD